MPADARRLDVAPVVVLLGGAAAAWIELVRIGPMAGMDGMPMPAPTFLTMWAAMVAAMMLPTIVPMVLACAAVLRGKRGGRVRLAAFVAPYAVLWLVAGLGALAVSRFAMDRPAVAATLIAMAGAYQLGALKERCLRACRSPVAFFVRYGAGLATAVGAARVGLRHAAACFGCCVGLMVALTAAGAVDLAWMVALAAVMLVEKVHPRGREFGRIVGVVLLALAPLVWARPAMVVGSRTSGLIAVTAVLVATAFASPRIVRRV